MPEIAYSDEDMNQSEDERSESGSESEEPEGKFVLKKTKKNRIIMMLIIKSNQFTFSFIFSDYREERRGQGVCGELL